VTAGLGDRQRQHGNLAAALVRPGKQLNSIRALCRMVAHQSNPLSGGTGIRDGDVVFLQKLPDIDRFDGPDRLTDGEKVWAAKLATLDSSAQCKRIVEHRADIEHGGKAPAVEHQIQLLIQFAACRVTRVQ
jgi:hypothetical protein